MARRLILRLEPYNPDAFDADNDGIVQEGTAWERPAGTKLVDSAGKAISSGFISPDRPRGLQVVDRNGNKVSYTPSYNRPGAQAPTETSDRSIGKNNPTLGDLIGTLGSKLPSLGALINPIGKPKESQQVSDQRPPEPPPPKKFRVPEFTTPLFGRPLVSKPKMTSKALFDERKGKYVRERRTLHKSIVSWYMQRASVTPKGEGEQKTIYWLGGGGGSGKSSAFSGGGINIPPTVMRVDPDEIKTMIPEYREWLNAGDGRAAEFVHEESKHIFENAVRGLVEMDSDFVYDTTGNGSYSKMAAKIADLKRKGHVVKARYMTISIEEALNRAKKREEEEGRVVPKSQLIHNHQEVSTNVVRALADGLFDDLELYDNESSNGPILIMRSQNGDIEILNPVLFKQFMDKSPSLARSPGPSPVGAHADATKGLAEARERLDDLLPEKKKALTDYTGGGYEQMNDLLRTGADYLTDSEYNEVARKVNTLDQVFDEASVVSVTPTKLYRGTVEFLPEDIFDDPDNIDPDKLIEALGEPEIGFKFTEEAYSSTSTSLEIAQGFAFGEITGPEIPEGSVPVPVLMEIDLPPNVRMLPGNEFESEALLERGMRYKIVGFETKRDPSGRPYRVMKVVARPPWKKENKIPLV